MSNDQTSGSGGDYQICRLCKKEKALTEFHKSPRNRFGVATACKLCHAEECAKWRMKNRDAARKLVKKWRFQNLEKARECGRRAQKKRRERPGGKEVAAKKAKEQRDKLCDHYVKATLLQGTTLKREQLPTELVEKKRAELLLRRLTRELRKGAKNETISNRT